MSNHIKRYHVEKRYSDMAVYNGVAYLAGQIAEDTTQDITGQTQEVLGMIDRLLAEVGSDRSRLLSVQIFLTDINDIAAMNAVWDQWVSTIEGNAPPRATVEAKLLDPAYKIEIVATAAC